MKKQIVWFTVVLFVSFSAWAQNPDAPEYIIQYTGGPVIDGDLSDWGNANMVTYDKDSVSDTFGTNWNDPNAVCTFAMMYNEEALYLAAEVTDNVISHADTTPYQWWTRDGVQWFFDFTHNPEQDVILYPDAFIAFEDNDRQWLPGETIIAIGATEDQTLETTRRWCVGTRQGYRSDRDATTLEDGTTVQGEVNEGWETIVIVEEGKYTVEVKVPWESLATSKYWSDPDPIPADMDFLELDKLGWDLMLPEPLPGSSVTFTHLCIDTDLAEGGFEAQMMWVGDGDSDTNWTTATFSEATPVMSWEIH